MRPLADEVDAGFFDRAVDAVARDLIGRTLRVTAVDGAAWYATIIESEAYGDAGDDASHAAFRRGGRAAVMSGPPGGVYVYSAYGMYPCLNFVTGPEGIAGAVLIRAVWRRGDPTPVFGPGRTTRLLGITPDDHGLRVPGDRFGLSVERRLFEIDCTPRIGITRGTETLWRFVAILGNQKRPR